MSATAEHAMYVYGVCNADTEPPHTEGIGGAPLREVASEGLAALVSDISGHDLKLGRDEMTAHARVLEEALTQGTVLPMRFGVVMAGEPAVKSDLLDAYKDDLRRQLSEMTGKVEVRIRAVYDETAVMREILGEDQEIARLQQTLRGASADATYYDRIRLGELVALAIERRRSADAPQILERLTSHAQDVHVGEAINELMVISASFLVDQNQLATFDSAVEEIGRAQADRIRVKYTGPLPPHSFVQLRSEA